MTTAPSVRPPNPESSGGWIGIDVGTSNCTASVWDLSRSRCKVLRFRRDGRTMGGRGGDGDDEEGGTIVPSAVLFYRRRDPGRDRDCDRDPGDEDEQGEEYGEGVGTAVGRTALRAWDDASEENGCGSDEKDGSTALITSVKRIAGMTARQAREMRENHPEFWNGLPFSPVILEDDGDEHDDDDGGSDEATRDSAICDVLGGAGDNDHHPDNHNYNNLDGHDDPREGIAIRVTPLSYDPLAASSRETAREHQGHAKEDHDEDDHTLLVTPLQATATLLRSLRHAADDYLLSPSRARRHGIRVPGAGPIRNAVLGVPADYSQSQRRALCRAARRAGFDGYVGVVTESTAAAMAYGLFASTSTTTITSETDASNEKRVLVFDMGGGTTDVTVAVLDDDDDSDDDDRVRFRVAATAGDSRLGGDDVDECLARYVWERHLRGRNNDGDDNGDNEEEWKASRHRELIRKCRRAKEELCGNNTLDDDDDDVAEEHTAGATSAQITLSNRTLRLTRHEFDAAIQPLLDRAARVVDDALSALPPPAAIHEVVLVGGSTRIPALRAMLRRKFPPPVPPDLCTSVSAETAVAQGLAIQAAWLSGAVPPWELRNALMLDALPHSIGVWVNTGDHDPKSVPFQKGDFIEPNANPRHRGHYVPILAKHAALPAAGTAAFVLADVNQPGVTVVAAERIGPGEVFQCMEVFHFLLHRLDKDKNKINIEERTVEVGMTLETTGRLVVSIFDEHDPEHRERRRRYRKEKGAEEKEEEEEQDRWNEFYREEEDDRRVSFSGTEIGLVVICAVLFALYVGARIAFSDLEMDPQENDEL